MALHGLAVDCRLTGFLMPLIHDLMELGREQMPELEDYDPALAKRTCNTGNTGNTGNAGNTGNIVKQMKRLEETQVRDRCHYITCHHVCFDIFDLSFSDVTNLASSQALTPFPNQCEC